MTSFMSQQMLLRLQRQKSWKTNSPVYCLTPQRNNGNPCFPSCMQFWSSPPKWHCLLQIVLKHSLMVFTEMGVAQLRIPHLQMLFSVSFWRRFPVLSQTTRGCFPGLQRCCCESQVPTGAPVFRKILGKGIGIKKVTGCPPGSYDCLTICPMVFLSCQKLSHTL